MQKRANVLLENFIKAMNYYYLHSISIKLKENAAEKMQMHIALTKLFGINITT